jgi:hypothetical protein
VRREIKRKDEINVMVQRIIIFHYRKEQWKENEKK